MSWDEWASGKMGYPPSEGQAHHRREAQGPPASFTFRSRCSSSTQTQGRRPRKTKDAPKKVPLCLCPAFTLSCLFPISLASPVGVVTELPPLSVQRALTQLDRQSKRPVCGAGDWGAAEEERAPIPGVGTLGEKGNSSTLCPSHWAQRRRKFQGGRATESFRKQMREMPSAESPALDNRQTTQFSSRSD